MASRSTNTMVEVLQRLLGDIAQAKTAMDADMPFLLQLETMILGKLRDPQTQMQQAGILPSDGSQQPAGGGMPPGMMMGGPPQGPPQGPPPMPQSGGLMPQAAPNSDELRRMLQQ